MTKKSLNTLPLPVIISAINSNENAVNIVARHYGAYIRSLATTTVHDDSGNRYTYVDEDKRTRLEVKLICSIINNFKILPV